MNHTTYPLQPIGVIHSAFDEKFGIPRQPGLARSITARVELFPPFGCEQAVRGLEKASHVWLIFVFSATADQGWKPTVRPPRLGGNKKLGVFASRSPFRPNPIGLSPVELLAIHVEGDQVQLEVRGADLLDGTPILDIKPYLPYADSLPEARFELAERSETLDLPIHWQPSALAEATRQGARLGEPLQQQIEEVLRCDPRPAYQRDPQRVYGISLHRINVRFRIGDRMIEILGLTPEENHSS